MYKADTVLKKENQKSTAKCKFLCGSTVKIRFLKKKILVLITVLILLSSTALASEPVQSYVIDLNGEKQSIPMAYSVIKTISYFDLKMDTLNEPSDIYIDSSDCLYILDAGNKRILKLDSDGKLIKEYKPTGDAAFNSPQGIYVDSEQNIYIADTGNGRIEEFDKNGDCKLVLKQPKSDLFDSTYPFKPLKVGLDKLGQIYVLNSLDYHGFTILDSEDNFKGYFASTRLSSDVWSKFISIFATGAQKAQIGQSIPPLHTNFTISDDGSIYTTTANVSSAQLACFSPVGNNFFPNQGSFGDTSSDYVMIKMGKSAANSNFVDVCVDSNGIVSVLDNNSGRIYQYDQDGALVDEFGGTGNWSGRFMNAVAMAIDSKGRIYVLDQNLGTVQIFQPTHFMQTVDQALNLYSNGKYIDAQKLWSQILLMDSSYPVAHIGMGKAELKQNKFGASMQSYYLAGDKYGYSNAFAGYFKQLVQNNFLLIVIIILAFTIGIYFAVSKLYAYAKKLNGGRSQ